MKFYQVDSKTLDGFVLGNSTRPTAISSPISQNEFIKVDESGKVFTMYDKPVWRVRHTHEAHEQLVLSEADLQRFKEVEGVSSRIRNVKFVVGAVDYENFWEKASFDNYIDAINHCVLLDGTDEDNWHQVRVEYTHEFFDKGLQEYVEMYRGAGIEYTEKIVRKCDVKTEIMVGWSVTRLSKVSPNAVRTKWLNAIIAMESL